MPRNVRNFWIEGSVDGRKSDISTGPRSSGGGFSCTIYVREEGEISDKKLRIGGQHVNGKNILSVELVDGSSVKELRLVVDRDAPPKPKVKKPQVTKPKPQFIVKDEDGYVKIDLDHAEVELCQSWYSGQGDPLNGLQCTGLVHQDCLESAISNLRKIAGYESASEDDVQTANGLIWKLEQFLPEEEQEPEEKAEPPQRQDAFWRIIEVEKN